MTPTLLTRALRGIYAGGAAGLAAWAAPAAAQTPADVPVPRVEVTGSNIRRAQAETASSVQVVNRADIERSGKSSVAELLQTLAIDNQGSVPASFGNGFAAGASGISLRGLGAASTLVLLNGRRMAPYGLADDGQKQFSDLNVIPTDAVERIEILKDGASAIYGSDAIAGVVNIILRTNFQGTTVRGLWGLSQKRDGREVNAAVTHGIGDIDRDRYNVLFSLEYKKFGAVWLRDRRDRDYIGRGDLRPWGFRPRKRSAAPAPSPTTTLQVAPSTAMCATPSRWIITTAATWPAPALRARFRAPPAATLPITPRAIPAAVA